MLIFYKICFGICSDHVPSKLDSNKKIKNKFFYQKRNLTRRRRRIHELLTRIKSPNRKEKLYKELHLLEKKLQKLYKDSRSNMEHKAINSIKENPKYFYSYAKKFSKIKSKVGPLLDSDNEMTSDPKEMANFLNDQYKSVLVFLCNTAKIVQITNQLLT